MVSKEQIEKILNKVISNDPTETDKCGGGSSSGSGGGKKSPKKKPSNKKSPKKLFEEFNRDDYKNEKYTNNKLAHPSGYIDDDWESPRGMLQKIQHELQMKMRDKYSYEDFESMERWSIDLFRQVNSYLFNKPDNHGKQWKGSDKVWFGGDKITLKKFSTLLSKAIDKSPRLQEPSVTYKLCPTDVLDKMKVGDSGKFDGFQATSFNYTVCTKAIQDQVGGWIKSGNQYGGSNRSIIRYHNMKGTKGVNIGDSVECHDWQSEWLLDKGQSFVYLGKGMVDYDGTEIMTYDVLVY